MLKIGQTVRDKRTGEFLGYLVNVGPKLSRVVSDDGVHHKVPTTAIRKGHDPKQMHRRTKRAVTRQVRLEIRELFQCFVEVNGRAPTEEEMVAYCGEEGRNTVRRLLTKQYPSQEIPAWTPSAVDSLTTT